VVVAVVGYIYCGIVFKQKCKNHGISVRLIDRSAFGASRELFAFAIPAFLAYIVVVPATWLTQALLANQPSGYSELGLFNAANQWRQFVIFIPTMMSSVMLAISADSYADGIGNKYRQAYRINMQLTWGCALPVSVLVIALGDHLNHLFGEKYADAVVLIPPLIAGAFFSVLNTVASSAVTGAGRMWAEAVINLVWAILLVGMSLWLVPSHGAKGLAYASLIAPIGQIAVRLVYIEQVLIPNFLADFWKSAVLSIMTLGAVLILSWDAKLNIYWGVSLTVIGAMPLLVKVRKILSQDGVA
jgi:O-antigen/teichoic acid export membrane protein